MPPGHMSVFRGERDSVLGAAFKEPGDGVKEVTMEDIIAVIHGWFS